MGYTSTDFLSYELRGLVDRAIIDNVLNSMSDCLLVLGEDGEIIYANNATKAILGYSFDDFRENGSASLFFLKDQDEQFNQIFIDAIWKKSVNDYSEVDYRHPDGTMKRLAATSSYLLAEGEKESAFIGFVVLFKDITEIYVLRRKELALEHDKDRIAQEKIRSLHKLAMGVAHEIRNPMVTMGGFASRILRDKEVTPTLKQYAQNILDDAKKLEHVVDEIQAYCNLPEIFMVRGNISNLIKEIVTEKTPLALDKDIRIRVNDGIPGDKEAYFDPILLKMAFSRLIDNAIDFSRNSGYIDINLNARPGSIIIVLKDYGMGITPQDKEFIFNPFFSTRIHKSGMGLAIVERIIHEHMGNIHVDTAPGKGTEIEVIIPYRSESDL